MNRRRFMNNKKKLVFFQQRFFPAGTYNWTVPAGCTSVDVFLVGGGGGARDTMPGGGGYTKTYKKDTTGYRDGEAIAVVPGEVIQIIVGKGGTGYTSSNGQDGGLSQFKNSLYQALGGKGGSGSGSLSKGGDGGSGASAWYGVPGTDGSNGTGSGFTVGKGQGHTTRDFGEPGGKRNAGGGTCNRASVAKGGASDYTEGTGGSAYTSGDDVGFVSTVIRGGADMEVADRVPLIQIMLEMAVMEQY